MATIQEIINKNFNDGEKEIAKKIYDVLIKPINTYIRKLEYEMEAISSRLPSVIQQADSMEVTKNGIVVIDFYAEWCMPCYELLPALETVAKEFEDVRFYKMDIDKHQDIAEKYNINAIPLVVVYRDGKEIMKLLGSPPNKDKRVDYIRWMVKRAFVPDDEFEKTKRMVEKIAKVKEWYLNPNEFVRNGLISALTYNRLKYGKHYCPCKPEHVKENICPCKPYKQYIGSEEMIEREGICYCGLFVSKEYVEEYEKYMKQNKMVTK